MDCLHIVHNTRISWETQFRVVTTCFTVTPLVSPSMMLQTLVANCVHIGAIQKAGKVAQVFWQ